MPKYGLISQVDANTIETTIRLVFSHFPKDVVRVTEVGIYSGETGNGIKDFIELQGGKSVLTGIDNKRDNEIIRYHYDKLIFGNSNEVYNNIPDNSQHLIIIDGNHSYPYVVSDYFCYRNKVKSGGYLCFHDAAPQAQGSDWQRLGDEGDPDMHISVSKALNDVGIFSDPKWKLIFFEHDENDAAGGVIIFKKLY